MDAAQLLKKPANPRIPRFSAGDTVNVNFRIREGERERIQVFQGVVIRLNNGKGPAANFTVRRITAGIGIERVFPLHSPLVESLEVTRYGSVRRARLYYLRGLQGRAARIKELNPVQRRKVQEETAAAMKELEEQATLTNAEAEELEELEAEEAIVESGEQSAEELVETPVDEVEESAEEAPPEDPAAEEPPAEEPPAEEPSGEATEEAQSEKD
ncbi:MAG: 50S ribosomal protein L19 [Chloroflexi bacterium]|nr:50S ribosomal protein L19 [Chloroflexota bacterium]